MIPNVQEGFGHPNMKRSQIIVPYLNSSSVFVPCHENDSESLSYEQKEWLKRRMSAPMGQPYKPFPPIEIPLRWEERT